MKPLLPTLKEKKRYIGFQVLAEKQPAVDNIKEALFNGVNSYLGELGAAKAGFSLISLSENKGIVRVSNKHVNEVKAAMLLIHCIGEQPAIFSSVGTSGTIKGVKKMVYGEAS
jgi:ribonuclease P/MRP protein subunit POP5